MPQRIALIITLLLANIAAAQPATAPAGRMPGWRAFVITFSPGKMVWERFGHNTLVLINEASTETYMYDFGNFDFNEKDFLKRFILGDMRYWAERKDAEDTLAMYRQHNRQYWGQELRISSQQAEQLWKNLEENVRADKKFYHYDYYRDNCSTRIRDHIDAVTGGAVRKQLEAIATESTYRSHTQLRMNEERTLLAAVEVALSAKGDRKLSAWEESFLPDKLMEHLGSLKAAGTDGVLVDQPLTFPPRPMNQYIDEATMVRTATTPPRQWMWFLPIGVAVGIASTLSGVAARGSTFGRIIAAMVWSGWSLFATIGGGLLLFMWLFTRHIAAYGNENLLHFSPLAIAMIVLAAAAAFGKWQRPAKMLALIIVLICIAGIVLKILPFMRQDNWKIIALALPANLGLWLGLVLRSRCAKLGDSADNNLVRSDRQ